jgi:hypothetical protein
MTVSLDNLPSALFCILLAAGLFIACEGNCIAKVVIPASIGTTRDTPAIQQATTPSDTNNASLANSPSADDSTAFAMRQHPYQPNPKKSGLYSAIIPGLGQAYNHQYWKVPVIYAGLGVAAYFITDNLKQYRLYRQAYIARLNDPNYVDQFTKLSPDPKAVKANLQQLENDKSKYLDLTVLFTGIGYLMQVVDAISSAHLKNFDISRDISMHVAPVAFPNGVGMGLVMNLK